ncbi:MAG: DUF4097 domain-containing protein [Oscillospiraceae bacterium]|nr:DUF4097 domain-containing protein [Oscillospiraceae bacterium]
MKMFYCTIGQMGRHTGSGVLCAKDVKAECSILDIGSGSFELSQAENFSAYDLSVNIGSGSAVIANAAATNYEIEMSSGKFDISGLTGTGKIDISSGKGIAEFAILDGNDQVFSIASGKLDVYIPENTAADLYTEIASGSVTVDCCGVSKKISDDRHIALNGGFADRFDNDHDFDHDFDHDYEHNEDHCYIENVNCGTIFADVSSGKISLFNSSEYVPAELTAFANVVPPDPTAAAVEEVTVTDGKTEQYG